MMAWLNTALLIGLILSSTASSQEGVFLSLKGIFIANNSRVDVDDIGEGGDALLCHTNNTYCCGGGYYHYRVGEWYFPCTQDMTVGILGIPPRNNSFYRNRGQQIIRLNRRGSPSERGCFRCEVPDANHITQIIFVNIVDNVPVISPSGFTTKTVGEVFSLVCSIDVYSLSGGPQPIFEWFFGPLTSNSSLPSGVTVSNVTNNVTNSSNTYTSTLQFSPLYETHAGMYTCQIGHTAVNTTISVEDPVINIVDFGIAQTAGETYNLTCIVTGIENLDPSLKLIYQWTKNNESTQIVVGNSKTLFFSPLKLSDVGQYICEVTIGSRMYGAIEYINIEIPRPSMHIASNQTNPIRPIGSAITLTCTVMFSEVVDVSVIVNIQMSDPSGSPLTTIIPSATGSTYVTTAMISSFGREQSGFYTCSVSIGSSRSWSVTKKVTVGVYLLLKGTIYANNSDIFINEIGETDDISLTPTQNNALQCVTDKSPCCRFTNSVGEWYFPNGTVILSSPVFYTNKGHDDGTVNLNFINSTSRSSLSVSTPTGLFCCVVPDIDDINQRLCANLDIVIVTIATSGNNTAGDIYSLECSVNGHSAKIQWFDESGVQVTDQGSKLITTSSVQSQLQFSPLHQSHGGRYTCYANVSRVVESQSIVLSVTVPNLVVKIKSCGIILTGGQDFSLDCIITGAENLNPILTYQWIKNNGTGKILIGFNTSSLSFSSLKLSDAGQYSCQVTVGSQYLHDAVNVTSTTFDIHLQVPQPVVRLVSDIPNPVRSDSSLILTCAVELSPAVDVPVAVSTVWTGPDGSMLMSAAPPVMKSFTHYTSKVKFNYVESADSGNYTCSVNIGGKFRASIWKILTIGDGMFQIQMKNADVCQPWYKSAHPDMEAELYKYHIEEALVEAIESRCECHFPKANLLKASFSCASSPNLTTYRNTLIGTHNFNATQLIGFIQDWVTSAPQININDYSVWLDSSCPVAIASLKEPECGEVSQCPCANDPNVIKCMENLENDNFAQCVNMCI